MISVGKGLLLIVSAGLAIVGICFGLTKKRPSVIEQIKGYQTWRKVNPKPMRLGVSTDVLCLGLQQSQVQQFQKHNPHFSRYITVYVNAVGEKAMFDGGTFPEGSVIVKEKRDGEDGPVILSTVMIKREKGYNSACGDWEFAATNALATKTDGEGKLESCMHCHSSQSSKDYLFKTYVNPAKGQTPVSGWDDGLGVPKD